MAEDIGLYTVSSDPSGAVPSERKDSGNTVFTFQVSLDSLAMSRLNSLIALESDFDTDAAIDTAIEIAFWQAASSVEWGPLFQSIFVKAENGKIKVHNGNGNHSTFKAVSLWQAHKYPEYFVAVQQGDLRPFHTVTDWYEIVEEPSKAQARLAALVGRRERTPRLFQKAMLVATPIGIPSQPKV